MNFRKLHRNEIFQFCERNGRYCWDDFNGTAAQLFSEYQQSKSVIFTEPVIDLYIATTLKNTITCTEKYTREMINNADSQTINQFANIMGIQVDDNVKSRIIRILGFMELIYPLTIREVLKFFSGMILYYEILTDVKVDEEWTIDRMCRHDIGTHTFFESRVSFDYQNRFSTCNICGTRGPVGGDLNGGFCGSWPPCECGQFDVSDDEYLGTIYPDKILINGGKQYLRVPFQINDYDDETDSPGINGKNIDIPATKGNMFRFFGASKLTLSNSFTDSIFVEGDPEEGIPYVDEISDVVFKLVNVDVVDHRILDYIEFKQNDSRLSY